MEVLTRVGSAVRAWRRTRQATIAVAGLSRSGKTAFITSVIGNLEAASHNSQAAQWLKGLRVLDDSRLVSAERPRDFRPSHGRMFPFSDMLSALTADAPKWPSRTANLYEVAIDIRFWPDQRPDRLDAPAANLRLIFVDYPGEWLVDVPLLAQSYADWSKAALGRLSTSPWFDLSERYQHFLRATLWADPDDNEIARAAAGEWQRVLLAARDCGLQWLQPGKFVRKPDQPDGTEAPLLDEEALWFCPLPEEVISAAKPGSLAARMASRYTAYQRAVSTFFESTLKDASHHLLLVDVLEALAEGEDAFHEAAEILAAVYAVFADRQSGFMRFFGRTGFDRVLLLATKADTVPPNQRPALKSLLEEMCQRRVIGAAKIAPPKVDFIAAVRATEDVDRFTDDGEKFRAVQGLCSATGRVRRVDSIDIPESMPTPDYFRRRKGLRVPSFVPAKVDGGARYGIANVRLGQALEHLLGDLLE